MIRQGSLLVDAVSASNLIPKTEGIKYAGSKLRILPYIIQAVNKIPVRTILDGFSGTTRVSQAFAQSGYRVTCNDTAVWSEMFGLCYLCNKRDPRTYVSLMQHFNSLRPVDGWFTENYGGDPNEGNAAQPDGLKKPWQKHNTRKLDAIRDEIDRLNLSKVERAVVLTSLILALDAVDSTIGHFASYLQKWSPRSYKHMILTVPRLVQTKEDHYVYRKDIFDLLPDIHVDLAYFDPPYGSNNEKMPPSRVRYSAYYHLWTSICLNDKPRIFGKAKRREDTSDTKAISPFEEFRKDVNGRFIAVNAIEQLIRLTNARWVLLSYSSGGRATAGELNEVLSRYGTIAKVMEIDYRRNVMANMKWTHEWILKAETPNKEFLFLLEK